ncbi:pathogenesis-related protein 1-like [Silene latifolia]|uniref:pathogenesis-related protein 1-like n=1 Tax=Silene latifolia TaxID=37657 RepID=UPI003D7770B1
MGWIQITIALIYIISILFCKVMCKLTQEDKDLIIKYHNSERGDVLVGPITWNKTLEKIATIEVSKCDIKVYRFNGPYGESSYGNFDADTWDVLGEWASQKYSYNYPKNNCTGRCENYLQMIWNNTRSIGCATKLCYGISEIPFYVCEYYPPGNIRGERPYRVPQ